MSAFADVTAARRWFVPDLVVWGLPGLGEIDYLTVETVDTTAAVHFNTVNVGAGQQQVRFDELIDDRGNSLPAVLDNPRVLVRPRSADPVFIVGRETPEAFHIARDPNTEDNVVVDLLIVELGS